MRYQILSYYCVNKNVVITVCAKGTVPLKFPFFLYPLSLSFTSDSGKLCGFIIIGVVFFLQVLCTLSLQTFFSLKFLSETDAE